MKTEILKHGSLLKREPSTCSSGRANIMFAAEGGRLSAK